MWLSSITLLCVSFLALQAGGAEGREKTGLGRSRSQAGAYDETTAGAIALWDESTDFEEGDDDDGEMGGGNQEGDSHDEGDDDRKGEDEKGGHDTKMSVPATVPMKIRHRSLQDLNASSSNPTTPPSPTQPSVEDITMLALCRVRVDKNGEEGKLRQYVRFNHPDFTSTRSKTIFSKISITAGKSDMATVNGVIEGIKFAGATADFGSKIAKATAVLGKIGSGFAALGAAAVLTTSILGAVGVLESQESKNFNALRSGLVQINENVIAIQVQIKEAVLDLKAFIGDVALDELAADLDAIGRSYNDYIHAPTELRLSKYESQLRDVCNTAFRTPEDIFYNLYGYVCDACTYAPRKRTNLRTVAEEQSGNDVAFFEKFGNFFLQSMMQAMALRLLCIDPIGGTCADRSIDEVWNNNTITLNAAMNEAVVKLTERKDALRNFVPKLTEANFSKYVTEDTNSFSKLQKYANDIRDFLTQLQPGFHFLVFVCADRCVDFLSGGIQYPFFNDDNATVFNTTGQILFRDINKSSSVYIRYRSKELPFPSPFSLPNFTRFDDLYRTAAASVGESIPVCQVGYICKGEVTFGRIPGCNPLFHDKYQVCNFDDIKSVRGNNFLVLKLAHGGLVATSDDSPFGGAPGASFQNIFLMAPITIAGEEFAIYYDGETR
ncbi:hypothetical protein MHU86_18442 [Fragilaria crotonensis]|nr:hypothetical protein MHU86_18442 [Fragilaria crotonensis]